MAFQSKLHTNLILIIISAYYSIHTFIGSAYRLFFFFNNPTVLIQQFYFILCICSLTHVKVGSSVNITGTRETPVLVESLSIALIFAASSRQE